MAASSSGDDIPAQLAGLLGRKTVCVRKTVEQPPRISVIDVAILITSKSANKAAQDVATVSNRFPDVAQNLGHVKFPDALGRKGHKETPVADVKNIIEITMLLPGRQAARVRRQAAELHVRYLGGDLSLVDEVCRIRGFQEEMASRRPDDSSRIFGETVETSGSNGRMGEQLVRIMSTMEQQLTTQEEILARIHERLEHDRQRVNLNVRAPKRAAPHQHQIATSIDGVRPFPVANFLNEKEREDPTWKGVRKSFAPAFGMQVQVLNL